MERQPGAADFGAGPKHAGKGKKADSDTSGKATALLISD